MKNDLENEVKNEKKKIKSYNTTHGIEVRTHDLQHNAGAAYHWTMCPVGESDVKLQYKLAQTRPVNIARMRDDPTSVIGLYDILHFCRQLFLVLSPIDVNTRDAVTDLQLRNTMLN